MHFKTVFHLHRYRLAFVDYQLVVNLNGSIEQAKMGCTRYGGWGSGDHVISIQKFRLSRLLRDELGSDWRKKLPLPSDHEVVMTAQRSGGITSASPSQQRSFVNAAVTSVEVKPSVELTEEQKLKKYEELKEKGNAYVKKVCNCVSRTVFVYFIHCIQGQYSDAVLCYTECIQLCPDNPVAYSNRALCHLKLSVVSTSYDNVYSDDNSTMVTSPQLLVMTAQRHSSSHQTM